MEMQSQREAVVDEGPAEAVVLIGNGEIMDGPGCLKAPPCGSGSYTKYPIVVRDFGEDVPGLIFLIYSVKDGEEL